MSREKFWDVYFDAIIPCTTTVRARNEQEALEKARQRYANGLLLDNVVETASLVYSDDETFQAHISNVVESDLAMESDA